MGRHDDDDGRGGDAQRDAGTGGELSMSIEETNKLRISLGLKPLSMEDSKPSGPSEEMLRQREEDEKAAKAEELAERVKQARERRLQQEALAATKKLGEAEPDVDDVMAWVGKSRSLEQQRQDEARRKQEEAAAAAGGGRRKGEGDEEEDEDDEDEDEEGGGGRGETAGHSAAELAGVKVKHSAEDLDVGETMILTLEDKGILDEKGNLVEEEGDLVLENILAREQKDRDKAWRASGKQAKPLWEEDGKRRGLLDKYDEEEEEMMQIDDSGAVEAAKQKRQEDIRARLAAAAGVLVEDAATTELKPASDFYSQEEMAKFMKPKKKKERKLKKKKALTADELAALEEAAAARGTSELGSRAERAERAQRKEAAVAAAAAERRQRFDQALEKANYASLALRGDDANGAAEEGAAEEDEDDLYASLSKARQLALRSSEGGAAPRGPESIAEELIRRREEATKKAAAASLEGGGGEAPDGSITFTDIAEVARNIQVKDEEEGEGDEGKGAERNGGAEGGDAAAAAAGPSSAAAGGRRRGGKGAGGGERMYGLEEEEMVDAEGSGRRKAAGEMWAGWVPATKAEPTAAELKAKIREKSRAQEAKQRAAERKAKEREEEAQESVVGEKAIGTGLAGALAFLKDRGELNQPVEWAGRMNDSKKVNIQGLDEVYTGGRHEDRIALDVEVALTRKDEFGRILPPKEAFRQLCHRFHGMQPSKGTKEKRARQVARELAQKKVASGAGEAETLEHMKQVQKQSATPYLVLSGTIKPGQSRDAASGYATVDRLESGAVAPTPVLGKLGEGHAPLVGNAKVEAMLGMKRKGGDSSMPPPPARKASRWD